MDRLRLRVISCAPCRALEDSEKESGKRRKEERLPSQPKAWLDVKIIREIVRLRKQDQKDREERRVPARGLSRAIGISRRPRPRKVVQ